MPLLVGDFLRIAAVTDHRQRVTLLANRGKRLRAPTPLIAAFAPGGCRLPTIGAPTSTDWKHSVTNHCHEVSSFGQRICHSCLPGQRSGILTSVRSPPVTCLPSPICYVESSNGGHGTRGRKSRFKILSQNWQQDFESQTCMFQIPWIPYTNQPCSM